MGIKIWRKRTNLYCLCELFLAFACAESNQLDSTLSLSRSLQCIELNKEKTLLHTIPFPTEIRENVQGVEVLLLSDCATLHLQVNRFTELDNVYHTHCLNSGRAKHNLYARFHPKYIGVFFDSIIYNGSKCTYDTIKSSTRFLDSAEQYHIDHVCTDANERTQAFTPFHERILTSDCDTVQHQLQLASTQQYIFAAPGSCTRIHAMSSWNSKSKQGDFFDKPDDTSRTKIYFSAMIPFGYMQADLYTLFAYDIKLVGDVALALRDMTKLLEKKERITAPTITIFGEACDIAEYLKVSSLHFCLNKDPAGPILPTHTSLTFFYQKSLAEDAFVLPGSTIKIKTDSDVFLVDAASPKTFYAEKIIKLPIIHGPSAAWISHNTLEISMSASGHAFIRINSTGRTLRVSGTGLLTQILPFVGGPFYKKLSVGGDVEELRQVLLTLELYSTQWCTSSSDVLTIRSLDSTEGKLLLRHNVVFIPRRQGKPNLPAIAHMNSSVGMKGIPTADTSVTMRDVFNYFFSSPDISDYFGRCNQKLIFQLTTPGSGHLLRSSLQAAIHDDSEILVSAISLNESMIAGKFKDLLGVSERIHISPQLDTLSLGNSRNQAKLLIKMAFYVEMHDKKNFSFTQIMTVPRSEAEDISGTYVLGLRIVENLRTHDGNDKMERNVSCTSAPIEITDTFLTVRSKVNDMLCKLYDGERINTLSRKVQEIRLLPLGRFQYPESSDSQWLQVTFTNTTPIIITCSASSIEMKRALTPLLNSTISVNKIIDTTLHQIVWTITFNGEVKHNKISASIISPHPAYVVECKTIQYWQNDTLRLKTMFPTLFVTARLPYSRSSDTVNSMALELSLSQSESSIESASFQVVEHKLKDAVSANMLPEGVIQMQNQTNAHDGKNEAICIQWEGRKEKAFINLKTNRQHLLERMITLFDEVRMFAQFESLVKETSEYSTKWKLVIATAQKLSLILCQGTFGPAMLTSEIVSGSLDVPQELEGERYLKSRLMLSIYLSYTLKSSIPIMTIPAEISYRMDNKATSFPAAECNLDLQFIEQSLQGVVNSCIEINHMRLMTCVDQSAFAEQNSKLFLQIVATKGNIMIEKCPSEFHYNELQHKSLNSSRIEGSFSAIQAQLHAGFSFVSSTAGTHVIHVAIGLSRNKSSSQQNRILATLAIPIKVYEERLKRTRYLDISVPTERLLVDDDSALGISDIQLTHSQSNLQPSYIAPHVIAVLSVSDGTLCFNGIRNETDRRSSTWQIAGSIPEVNTVLSHISYIPSDRCQSKEYSVGNISIAAEYAAEHRFLRTSQHLTHQILENSTKRHLDIYVRSTKYCLQLLHLGHLTNMKKVYLTGSADEEISMRNLSIGGAVDATYKTSFVLQMSVRYGAITCKNISASLSSTLTAQNYSASDAESLTAQLHACYYCASHARKSEGDLLPDVLFINLKRLLIFSNGSTHIGVQNSYSIPILLIIPRTTLSLEWLDPESKGPILKGTLQQFVPLPPLQILERQLLSDRSVFPAHQSLIKVRVDVDIGFISWINTTRSPQRTLIYMGTAIECSESWQKVAYIPPKIQTQSIVLMRIKSCKAVESDICAEASLPIELASRDQWRKSASMTGLFSALQVNYGSNISMSNAFVIHAPSNAQIKAFHELYSLNLRADSGKIALLSEENATKSSEINVNGSISTLRTILQSLHYFTAVERGSPIDLVYGALRRQSQSGVTFNGSVQNIIRINYPPDIIDLQFRPDSDQVMRRDIEHGAKFSIPPLFVTILQSQKAIDETIILINLQSNLGHLKFIDIALRSEFDGISINASLLPYQLQYIGPYARVKSALKNVHLDLTLSDEYILLKDVHLEVKACAHLLPPARSDEVCDSLRFECDLKHLTNIDFAYDVVESDVVTLDGRRNPLDLSFFAKLKYSVDMDLPLLLHISADDYSLRQVTAFTNCLQNVSSIGRKEMKKSFTLSGNVSCLHSNLELIRFYCQKTSISTNFLTFTLKWAFRTLAKRTFDINCQANSSEVTSLHLQSAQPNNLVSVMYQEAIYLHSIFNFSLSETSHDLSDSYRLQLSAESSTLYFDDDQLSGEVSYALATQNAKLFQFSGSFAGISNVFRHVYLASVSITTIAEKFTFGVYVLIDNEQLVHAEGHANIRYQHQDRSLSWYPSDDATIDVAKANEQKSSLLQSFKIVGRELNMDLPLELLIECGRGCFRLKVSDSYNNIIGLNCEEMGDTNPGFLQLHMTRGQVNDVIQSIVFHGKLESTLCKSTFDSPFALHLRVSRRDLSMETAALHLRLNLEESKDIIQREITQTNSPYILLEGQGHVTLMENDTFDNFTDHFKISRREAENSQPELLYRLTMTAANGTLSLSTAVCCMEMHSPFVTSKLVLDGTLDNLNHIMSSIQYIPDWLHISSDVIHATVHDPNYQSYNRSTAALSFIIKHGYKPLSLHFKQLESPANLGDNDLVIELQLFDLNIPLVSAGSKSTQIGMYIAVTCGKLQFDCDQKQHVWQKISPDQSSHHSVIPCDRFQNVDILGSYTLLKSVLGILYYRNTDECFDAMLSITINDDRYSSETFTPSNQSHHFTIRTSGNPDRKNSSFSNASRLLYDPYSDSVMLNKLAFSCNSLPPGGIYTSTYQSHLSFRYTPRLEVQGIMINSEATYAKYMISFDIIRDAVTQADTANLIQLTLSYGQNNTKIAHVYADAVAMKSDERLYASIQGHNIGQSVESVFEILYGDTVGFIQSIQVVKITQSRKIAFKIYITMAKRIELPLQLKAEASDTRTQAQIFAECLPSIESFRLGFGNQTTSRIPLDILAMDLQSYLEEIELIDMVKIYAIPETDYHWEVTFLTYWNPFPLLTGELNGKSSSSSYSTNTSNELIANPLKEADIQTYRISQGQGHGSLYRIEVGLRPTYSIYKLTTWAVDRLSGTFSLGFYSAQGDLLSLSSNILVDAAAISEETLQSRSKDSGAASLEYKLLDAIARLPHPMHAKPHIERKTINETRNLFEWRITLHDCSRDFPTIRIVDTSLLHGMDATVMLQLMNASQSLGGNFSLHLAARSVSLPWNASASEMEDAINDLASSSEFSFESVLVRKSRKENFNGHSYGILFISERLPMRNFHNSNRTRLSVNGVNLIGDGAFSRSYKVYEAFEDLTGSRMRSDEKILQWNNQPLFQKVEEPSVTQRGVTYELRSHELILKATSMKTLNDALPTSLQLQLPFDVNGGDVQLDSMLRQSAGDVQYECIQSTKRLTLPAKKIPVSGIFLSQKADLKFHGANHNHLKLVWDNHRQLLARNTSIRVLAAYMKDLFWCLEISNFNKTENLWVNGTVRMLSTRLYDVDMAPLTKSDKVNGYGKGIFIFRAYHAGKMITNMRYVVNNTFPEIASSMVQDLKLMYNASTVFIDLDGVKNTNVSVQYDEDANLFVDFWVQSSTCSTRMNQSPHIYDYDNRMCIAELSITVGYGEIIFQDHIEQATIMSGKVIYKDRLAQRHKIRAELDALDRILQNGMRYRCPQDYNTNAGGIIDMTISRPEEVVSSLDRFLINLVIAPPLLIPVVHFADPALVSLNDKSNVFRLAEFDIYLHSARSVYKALEKELVNPLEHREGSQIGQRQNVYSMISIPIQAFRSSNNKANAKILYELHEIQPRLHLCHYKSKSYFNGHDPSHGTELWVSDGTFGSTMLFIDLYPGPIGSEPEFLTIMRDKMYFSANGLDMSWALDLKSCNGIRTLQLKNSEFLYVVAKKNIWERRRAYDCPTDYVWASSKDFTESAVGLLDEHKSYTDAIIYWNYCDWNNFEFGGLSRKYFRFSDSFESEKLQHAGHTLADPLIVSGTIADFAGIVCKKSSNTSTHKSMGRELWVSNGTPEGTRRLSNIQPASVGSSPRHLTPISSVSWLVFQATTKEYGQELYKSDGTEAGTSMIEDIWPGPKSSDPTCMTEIESEDGQVLILYAARTDLGRELWVSHINLPSMTASTQGSMRTFGRIDTYLLRDIYIGVESSNPREFVFAQTNSGLSVVFFSADDGIHGRELWFSDGTASGTTQVIDLHEGERVGSNPTYLTAYSGRIYFQAYVNPSIGAELYSTDGSAHNTRLEIDVSPGPPNSKPSCLTVIKSSFDDADVLTFAAFDANGETKIYSFDSDKSTYAPITKNILHASYTVQTTSRETDTYCNIFGSQDKLFFIAQQTLPPRNARWNSTFAPHHVQVSTNSGVLQLPRLQLVEPLSYISFQAKSYLEVIELLREIIFSPADLRTSNSVPRMHSTEWKFEITGSDNITHTTLASLFIPTIVSVPCIVNTGNTTLLLDADAPASLPITSVVLSNHHNNCNPVYSIDQTAVDEETLIEFNASLAHSSIFFGELGCFVLFEGHEDRKYVTRKHWHKFRLVAPLSCINNVFLRQWYVKRDVAYRGVDSMRISVALFPAHDSAMTTTQTHEISFAIHHMRSIACPYVTCDDYYECNEDSQLSLDSLFVADAGAMSTSHMWMKIFTAHGRVQLQPSFGDVEVEQIDGNASSFLSMKGSLSSIQKATKHLIFSPDPDWNSMSLLINSYPYDPQPIFASVNITLGFESDLDKSSDTQFLIFVNPVQDEISIRIEESGKCCASNLEEQIVLTVAEDTTLGLNSLRLLTSDAVAHTWIRAVFETGVGVLRTAGKIADDVMIVSTVSMKQMQFRGKLIDVSAAINFLQYQPQGDFNGNDTLIVTVYSQNIFSKHVPVKSQLQLSIIVKPVNDAPCWLLGGMPQPGSIIWHADESGFLLIDNLTISDVDLENFDESVASSHDMELSIKAEGGSFVLPFLADANVNAPARIETKKESEGFESFAIVAPYESVRHVLTKIIFQKSLHSDKSATTKPSSLDLIVNDRGGFGAGFPQQVHLLIQLITQKYDPTASPTCIVGCNVEIHTPEHPIELQENSKYHFDQVDKLIYIHQDSANSHPQHIVQVNITCQHGLLSSLANPLVAITGNETYSLQISGSINHVNITLQQSIYNPESYWYGQDTLKVQLWVAGTKAIAYRDVYLSITSSCGQPIFAFDQSPKWTVMKEDSETRLYIPTILISSIRNSDVHRHIVLDVAVKNNTGDLIFTKLNERLMLSPTRLPNSSSATVSGSISQESFVRQNISAPFRMQGHCDDINEALGHLLYRPHPDHFNSLHDGILLRQPDEISFLLYNYETNEDTHCARPDNEQILTTVYVQVSAVHDMPIVISDAYTPITEELAQLLYEGVFLEDQWDELFCHFSYTLEAFEDTPLVLESFAVRDADILDSKLKSDRLQLNLTAINGDISLRSSKGVCNMDDIFVLPRTDMAASSLVLVSSQEALSCIAQNQFEFVAYPNYNGDAFITVRISDLGFGGSDGEDDNVYALHIHVQAINDLPKFYFPQATPTIRTSTTMLLVGAPSYQTIYEKYERDARLGETRPFGRDMVLHPALIEDVPSLQRIQLIPSGNENLVHRVHTFSSSLAKNYKIEMVAYKESLIFTGYDKTHGHELWKLNDNGDRAQVLKDIHPGTSSSMPYSLTYFAAKDQIIFAANGVDTSWRLKESDYDDCEGIRHNSNDHRVALIVSHEAKWQINKVYNCPTGYTWMSTADAQTIFTSKAGDVARLTYFDQCGWNGYEWKGMLRKRFRFSDSKTTGAFKHTASPETSEIDFDLNVEEFAGIVCWKNLDKGVRDQSGVELWTSDGSVEGTRLLADINPGHESSFPSSMYEYRSTLFFQATTNRHGSELWRSDGTLDDTKLLANIEPGSRSSYPEHMIGMGSKLFLSAHTSATGCEVWYVALDEDSTSTRSAAILSDICIGPGSSNPKHFQVSNVLLIFQADDCHHGPELWVSDGTPSGTLLLADLHPGSIGSNPSHLYRLDATEKVYFQADDGVHGTEIWMTDGTAAGTNMLIDLTRGSIGSDPVLIAPQSPPYDYLFFHSKDPESGHSYLWRTDGSALGTQKVYSFLHTLDYRHELLIRKRNRVTELSSPTIHLYFVATDSGDDKMGFRTVDKSYHKNSKGPVSLALWDVDALGDKSHKFTLTIQSQRGIVSLSLQSLCSVDYIKGSWQSGTFAGTEVIVSGSIDSLNCAVEKIWYTATETNDLYDELVFQLVGLQELVSKDSFFVHVEDEFGSTLTQDLI